MWGPSIVGYGTCRCVSPSDPRRTGQWPRTGFSPRKRWSSIQRSGRVQEPRAVTQRCSEASSCSSADAVRSPDATRRQPPGIRARGGAGRAPLGGMADGGSATTG
ncbi:hypothetical protein C5C13_15185 [Clavibacter michiganensis]|nr:hypothetical protein C5C13_15185 [Clavibacter michiganensis]